MFILAKRGKRVKDINMLCRTPDKELCVWYSEEKALQYAEKYSYENWVVIPATSEEFSKIGRVKGNKTNRTRACYKVMDRDSG